MIRNSIRHGVIAFGAGITCGACAYAARGEADVAFAFVSLGALIFGALAAVAHSEAS